MDINKAIGMSLKEIRQSKGLTQEDFSDISSRTYISDIERGVFKPTLFKIDELSKKLGVHPLTLITYAYSKVSKSSLEMLHNTVKVEFPIKEQE